MVYRCSLQYNYNLFKDNYLNLLLMTEENIRQNPERSLEIPNSMFVSENFNSKYS